MIFEQIGIFIKKTSHTLHIWTLTSASDINERAFGVQLTEAVVAMPIVAHLTVTAERSRRVDTHRVGPTVVLVPRTLVNICVRQGQRAKMA